MFPRGNVNLVRFHFCAEFWVLGAVCVFSDTPHTAPNKHSELTIVHFLNVSTWKRGMLNIEHSLDKQHYMCYILLKSIYHFSHPKKRDKY